MNNNTKIILGGVVGLALIAIVYFTVIKKATPAVKKTVGGAGAGGGGAAAPAAGGIRAINGVVYTINGSAPDPVTLKNLNDYLTFAGGKQNASNYTNLLALGLWSPALPTTKQVISPLSGTSGAPASSTVSGIAGLANAGVGLANALGADGSAHRLSADAWQS